PRDERREQARGAGDRDYFLRCCDGRRRWLLLCANRRTEGNHYRRDGNGMNHPVKGLDDTHARCSVFVQISGLFDHTNTVWTGNDSHFREPYEKSVLHDPWDSRQPLRQCLRRVNAPKRYVDDPVAAIRDERMAILAAPQHRFAGAATG